MVVSHLENNKLIRVLVVDDEPEIYLVLVRAFKLLGYYAAAAASGEEALALLQRETFDIMILDMALPDIAGVEVMKKAQSIHRNLPIIILTGNATLESAIAAIKSEAIDYLLKPVNLHDIVDAVNIALQKRATRMQKEQLADSISLLQGAQAASTLTQETLLSRSILVVPPLRLDRAYCTLVMMGSKGHTVKLTRGETAVLACLMTQPHHAFSCEQIVRTAWGEIVDRHQAESIVRPYILRLRQKIEPDPAKPILIRTVRQVGYLLASAEDA